MTNNNARELWALVVSSDDGFEQKVAQIESSCDEDPDAILVGPGRSGRESMLRVAALITLRRGQNLSLRRYIEVRDDREDLKALRAAADT